jgi:hypothetical protein
MNILRIDLKRLVTAIVVFGLIEALLFFATYSVLHAQEIDPDVASWAEWLDVDPIDYQGAVATTGLGPEDYAIEMGWVEKPAPVATIAPASPGWPIGGALGARIYCIEGIESRHGAAMYNPQPWYGEHAQGWLGYLPSTARAWGVTIGNRQSEWDGAARMFATLSAREMGRQFYGVGAGLC